MNVHKNARSCPASRELLVKRVCEQGWSVREASAAGVALAPGVALGQVSSTGYLGFLAGPTLIGGVAELTGLPTALWLLVGLALLVSALGPATRPAHVVPRRLAESAA